MYITVCPEKRPKRFLQYILQSMGDFDINLAHPFPNKFGEYIASVA